ncbi:helix-turn-helix domain-containing protein [Paenibacillus radicibacter]|uniref:helix-turn-helix domain-containing protein n=1 Tax=Paenibacillus radicibacter TaxID=2972488 RepID=UPI00358ED224
MRINLNDPEIMDSKTAVEKWNIDDSTLRKRKNDFPEGTIRKIGNSWAVTREGMEAVFGKLLDEQHKGK